MLSGIRFRKSLYVASFAFAILAVVLTMIDFFFVLRVFFAGTVMTASVALGGCAVLSFHGSRPTASIDTPTPPPSFSTSTTVDALAGADAAISTSPKGLKNTNNTKRRPPPSAQSVYLSSLKTMSETSSSPTTPPLIMKELALLIDLIARDFIIFWYKTSVSPDPSFVTEVQSSISHIFSRIILSSQQRFNLPSLLLSKATRALSLQISTYRRLRSEVAAQNPAAYEHHLSSCSSNSPFFHQLVAKKFADNNKLHSALTMGRRNASGDGVFLQAMEDIRKEICESETQYVRMVSKSMCSMILSEEDLNNGMVRELLSEVINTCILVPVVGVISEPSNLNYWILGGINSYLKGDNGGVINSVEVNDVDREIPRRRNESDVNIDRPHPSSDSAHHPPGTPPSHFCGGESADEDDVGWHFFAGVMSSAEASLLLKGHGSGSFLVRKDVRRSEHEFVVTYVVGDFDACHYGDEIEKDTSLVDIEALTVSAKSRVHDININAYPCSYSYADRDDFYWSNVILLSEKFPTLASLLHVLKDRGVDFSKGIPFQSEMYDDEVNRALEGLDSPSIPPVTTSRTPKSKRRASLSAKSHKPWLSEEQHWNVSSSSPSSSPASPPSSPLRHPSRAQLPRSVKRRASMKAYSAFFGSGEADAPSHEEMVITISSYVDEIVIFLIEASGKRREVEWDDPYFVRAAGNLVRSVEGIVKDGALGTNGNLSVDDSDEEEYSTEEEGDPPLVTFNSPHRPSLECPDSSIRTPMNRHGSTHAMFYDRHRNHNNDTFAVFDGDDDEDERYKNAARFSTSPTDNNYFSQERRLSIDSSTESIDEATFKGVHSHDSEGLRAVIAAWLQTGSLYKMVKSIIRSGRGERVGKMFYEGGAFIRDEESSTMVLQILKKLDGIEIKVDTTAICKDDLLEVEDDQGSSSEGGGMETEEGGLEGVEGVEGSDIKGNVLTRLKRTSTGGSIGGALNKAARLLPSSKKRGVSSQSIFIVDGRSSHTINYFPNKLTLSRHAVEREKAVGSWNRTLEKNKEEILGRQMRDGMSVYHNFARLLVNNCVRFTMNSKAKISLKKSGPVRKAEVIEDDSTLLFATRPKRITPIRSHSGGNRSKNYLTYAATWRETLECNSEGAMRGASPGVKVLRCKLHFFPFDNTAKVEGEFLPLRFVDGRASCRKTNDRGELLGDFMAEDFVCGLKGGGWKKPIVNIMGVYFTIHDSVNWDVLKGIDASANELSCATLSYGLLSMGNRDSGGQEEEGAESIVIEVVKSTGGGSLCVSELRSSINIATMRATAMALCLNDGKMKRLHKKGRDIIKFQQLTLSTLGMLQFASSKGGGEQLLRTIGRPGLNGTKVELEELKRKKIWREAGSRSSIKAEIEGILKQENPEIFGKPVIMYKIRVVGERLEDETGNLIKEEWVVVRRYNDFVSLHKMLKSQITSDDLKTKTLSAKSSEGFFGLKLLPSLPPKKTLTKGFNEHKFIQERGRQLNTYLKFLTDRRHVLSTSFELLTFLSAVEAIGDVLGGAALKKNEDIFGRRECNRTYIKVDGMLLREGKVEEERRKREEEEEEDLEIERVREDKAANERESIENERESEVEKERRKERTKSFAYKTALMASIQARIRSINAKDVQENVFDLVNNIFNLDKANFLRGRVIAVVRGMAFFLTENQFYKTLLNYHRLYVNEASISGVLKYVRELLWPQGEWAESVPPMTDDEKERIYGEAFGKIHSIIPEVVTNVLGEPLAKDGVNIVFEMVQNEVVLKSFVYMLVDLILLELYPEMSIDLDSYNAVVES